MLKELQSHLDRLLKQGKTRGLAPALRKPSGRVYIRGKNVLNLTSWDYLGLAQERSVKRAIQAAIEEDNFNTGSPRLVSGTRSSHLACERRLAEFLGTEAALLFSSRNQAVLSLVIALMSEGDFLLMPEGVHSPVADAAYLINAEVRTFSSEAPENFEAVVEKLMPGRRKFVFLETLSPWDGRLADLVTIAKIANKYSIVTIVDESFALGALGLRGAGAVEHFGLLKDFFARVGDLGLGLGNFGGFVAGERILIDYLVNRSKTLLLETAFPAPVCEGIVAAIDLCELGELRRARLRQSAQLLRRNLIESGCRLVDSPGPVVTLPFPRLSLAGEFCEGLFQRGFLAEAVSHPGLLQEVAGVRLVCSHTLEESELLEFVDAVSAIRHLIGPA